VPTIEAIAVIALTPTTLITTTAQKIGQFHIHKGGQVSANALFHIATDHFKKTFRLLTDLVDKFILRPIETGQGEGVEVRLSGGQGEKL